MRGKNILWLTMAVLLLSVGFINVGFTQEAKPAVIAVNPETVFGHPGDYFDITITISNVVDLRAFGFVLDFAPFTSVLNIWDVIEGDFLSEGAPPDEKTFFLYSVDTFAGELTVGCNRHKEFGGVSGSGTLVIVRFNVVEAGKSPLNLEEVKLYNTAGDPIPYTVINGEYLGPTATLKHPKGSITKNKWRVGETAEFKMRVKNTGDVPLYVKVRFAFHREDGEAAYIWTGQSYTGFGPKVVDVAYVDGYIPWLNMWTSAGPPEALIGPPDGSYIQSDGHCAVIGFYTFEDIDTKGRIVEDVEFYAYSRCSDTASDIDSLIFTYDEYGNPVMAWAWANSQGGTTTWAWTNKKYYYPAYNFPEYYGDHILTQQGINSAEMVLHNFYGGWQQVDAYKMEVTYSKYTPAQGNEASYLVMPGQTIDLPPAVWFVSSFDVGHYYASATVYYSYYGDWFVRGDNPPAFNFAVTFVP